MKVYIAGKIAGDERYKEKFQKAAEPWTAEGHVVVNPAILPEGMTPSDYMRICFAMIDSADLVDFLPDYAQSRGAMLEHQYCQYISKPTYYAQEEAL